MSARPLWALTRATDRSFGRAFNFASKSILPSMRRRLFAPPEATWYWRSVFRRQFPSCVFKSKSLRVCSINDPLMLFLCYSTTMIKWCQRHDSSPKSTASKYLACAEVDMNSNSTTLANQKMKARSEKFWRDSLLLRTHIDSKLRQIIH